MIRPLLWLSGLVLVLGLADGWLAARAARARTADARVGTLFTPAEVETLRKQPALRIEQGNTQHRYGRVQGSWRCLSRFDAPADGRALQAWLDALLAAEGLVHARTVDEAPAYGINVPETVRVSIQGPRAAQDPGGDVLAGLELGLTQPGRAACFVRRHGSKEIWSVSGDLRAPLEAPRAPGLPPLLAPSALPPGWLEQGGGLVEIRLERNGARVVLRREERALDPEQVQPGAMPWIWVLETEDGASELDTRVAEAFADFLERLPYVDVLDPELRSTRGAGNPRAVLTLTARAGAPLALAFGTSGRGERVALWVEASTTLYEIESAAFDLAVPDPDRLRSTSGEEDPWSAALRAEEQERER
jgi:hypothetical protein